MSGDIAHFLEKEKLMILENKKRLGLCMNAEYAKNQVIPVKETCDREATQNNNCEQSFEENKENIDLNSSSVLSPKTNQTLPFIEQLDLNSKRDQDSNAVSLEEKKQALIDSLVNCEHPFTDRSDASIRCAMLRYGEYSPNNPQLRVTAAPYLGLGEYEQRRNYFLQKQRAEYLRHLAKKNENIKVTSKHILSEKNRSVSETEKLELSEKSVQTDIQNIQNKLVQYALQSQNSPEKELSPLVLENDKFFIRNHRNSVPFRVDQRLTSAQNALLNPEMDKPKSILSNRKTGSPRGRQVPDLYAPTFMDGFSYQESHAEVLERERQKRDAYQRELRAQIDEKRGRQRARDEQERREREIENRRLEQQLDRMRDERMVEEERRSHRDEQMRRHSEDLLRRKQELQSRPSYRKHTDSESSVTNSIRNNPNDSTYKSLSHYSPPVSRRNPYTFNNPSTSVFSEPTARYNSPTGRFDNYNRRDNLKRMDSLNSYDPPPRHQTFSRFDSLSKIDSLTQRMDSINFRDDYNSGQRRHSASQQDYAGATSRRSPRLQRRCSSGRFEDGLPAPVLKAHSPVARELKNAVPFNSARLSSEVVRRLEDRWQNPTVQKNIVNHTDSSKDGQTRSILTQLGAIRMQLQQEQLRMDESLRKKDVTQSKAVDFH
ncbi:unnamed protein product [Phaedon cochleariae]|uniref:Uncharacterized protein n=1 Tax=Phaedon cochleariae TaxID=80249 RepID=A0A9P0DH48_PHACE|nr:unnamed protein product [Phaedon cochleariae]